MIVICCSVFLSETLDYCEWIFIKFGGTGALVHLEQLPISCSLGLSPKLEVLCPFGVPLDTGH